MKPLIDRDLAVFAAFAGGKGLVAAANLVVTVVVGRVLGPEGLGQWVLLLAAATFLHTTFINWTHPGTVRFGCEEWVSAGTLSRTISARLLLLVPSGLAAVLVLTVNPFDWTATAYGLGGLPVALVGVYALGLWLGAEAQAVFQARADLTRQAIVASVAAGATVVAVGALVGLQAQVELAHVVWIASSVAIVIWGGALVAQLAASRVRLVRPSREEFTRQLRYAAPLLVGFAVAYVSIWGNHVILRQLAPVEELGYFGLSYQVFASILAANGMLPTLLLPRLVGAQVRSAETARVYVQHAVPSMFVMWAIGLIVATAILPSVLLRSSGPAFAPAAVPMIVLCAVVPASVLTSLYAPLFNLQERHGRILLYAAMMAVISVALSVLLVPSFGATGAALATVAASGAAQIAYARDQHHQHDVPMRTVGRLWLVLIAAGAVQAVIGAGLAPRLLWAAASIAALVWVSRRTSAVSQPIVDRLFGGALSPVGAALRRLLIAPAPPLVAAAGGPRAGAL